MIRDRYNIFFQANSELVDLFNYHLIKMHQTGLIEFLMHKWCRSSQPEDSCKCKYGEGAFSLGFPNLLSPVILLLLGIVASFLLNVLENFVAQKRK